jgi:tetratricopeptide (TPR) repeat protein
MRIATGNISRRYPIFTSMESQSPTPKSASPSTKPTSARRQRMLLGVLLLILLSGGGWRLSQDYHKAALYEQTLPELEASLAKTPNDETGQLVLAYRHMQAQEYAKAATILEKVASLGNTDLPLWKTWLAAAAVGDKKEQVLTILQSAKNHPRLRSFAEESEKKYNQLGESASGADIAMAIAPEGTESFAKAYITPNYWNQGWGKGNGVIAQEAQAKKNPQDIRIQTAWAQALVKNHRYNEAAIIIEPIAGANPENVEVLLTQADAYYGQGRVARAGIIYRDCTKKQPNSFPAYLGLAQASIKKQMVYQGMEAATKATELNPQSEAAWAALGTAYFAQKMRWDKACESFDKAQKLNPDNLSYYGPYFDSLRLANRPEDAEKVVRRRIAQDPTDARAHFLLGVALLDSPTTQKEAEQSLRESLRLAPNTSTGQTRLAQVLIDQEKYEEAAERLEVAARLEPTNMQALTLLIRAYKMLHRPEEVAKVEGFKREMESYLKEKAPLEDTLMKEPLNVSVRQKLQALYESAGDAEQAKQQAEMIDMIKKHPQEAKKGIIGMMKERVLVGSEDLGKDPPSPAPQENNKTP